MLVTTPGVHGLAPIYERIKKILTNAGVELAHFDQVVPNPTTDTISEGTKAALEHKADIVLGLGGGSSMDTAKAIAVEATHEGSCWDYLFYKTAPAEKTLPIVAISTTSGTGSQVTQVAVITNTANRDKSAIYNPIVFPKTCIVDPELMLTLPKQITAPTGFDVFCHAFESILNPGTGAYVELLANEAIRIVAEYLPKVLDNLSDIEAREKMAWADTMAGLCIASSGVTMPHGMGMAIGGMYPHVAHGEALAIVYPACAHFTYNAAIPQFSAIGRIFNSNLCNVSDEEAAEKSCEEIEKFIREIGLWKNLNEVNMLENEIEALSKQSMVLPDYKSNPRVATPEEMLELVKQAYDQ